MDEQHLLAAARYIEMNQVAAQLVEQPHNYRWSSIHTHPTGADDDMTRAAPLLELVSDWEDFLQISRPEEINFFHRHERTSRPLAGVDFIKNLEKMLNRRLRPQKPGPKKSEVS